MFRCIPLVAVLAVGALALPAAATAETLLIERVAAEQSLPLPDRGLSMSDIEARYGAPLDKMEPKGGQKPQWPVIHRWVYPEFTIYFEKSHVIDVVARKASPVETGPKPVR
jgi:hypothetical protein